jgi:hypothetical protein
MCNLEYHYLGRPGTLGDKYREYNEEWAKKYR